MCKISKFSLKFIILILFLCVNAEEIFNQNSATIVARNVTFTGKITVKEINKPHNLFIGRCTKKYPVLYQENVVLNNDGKSQVTANIRINVEGPVRIICVKIYDEDPDVMAYPSYSSGGIGKNFIEFNVLTTYGKGFKFFVQIFGVKLD